MKKLYEGKGNLVRRAQNIKTLGARTSKVLDQNLIDRANAHQDNAHEQGNT
jgi:DNA recombination protein RmuC